MVNRSMQAKDLKRKRRGKQKSRTGKAVNTGSSYINYSSGPNKEEMILYKNRTGNTLFRNNKTGSISVNQSLTPERIAYWELMYPSMKYSQKMLKELGLPDEYGIIHNNPVPRGQALALADRLLAAKEALNLQYLWRSGPSLKVSIRHNSKRTQFIMVEVDLDRRWIRTSEVERYSEILTNAYPRKVRWKSIIPIGAEEE